MDAKKTSKIGSTLTKADIDLEPYTISQELHIDSNSQLVSIYARKLLSKIAAMYSVRVARYCKNVFMA